MSKNMRSRVRGGVVKGRGVLERRRVVDDGRVRHVVQRGYGRKVQRRRWCVNRLRQVTDSIKEGQGGVVLTGCCVRRGAVRQGSMMLDRGAVV